MKTNLMTALLTAAVLAAPAFNASAQTAAQREQQLIAVIKSDAGQKEKADACRELGRVGSKAAVPVLAALLSDEKLSHMARYGLETIPDPAVDEALRAALGALKGNLQIGVIGSLGLRRDAKAVPALTGLLSSADQGVAQAAARALGSIGSSDAAKAIQAALPKAPAASQLAFAEGLFRCAEALAAAGKTTESLAIYDQLRALPGPHQVRAGGLRGAIVLRKKEGLPLLKQSLQGNDWILFHAAVRAAQEMPGAEVTQLLAGELKGLAEDKQVVVAQTLGLKADAAALPALFSLAKEGTKPARLAALRALGMIGAAASVAPLLEQAADSDREIAQAALESLASLPGREVENAIVSLLGGGTAAQRMLAMDLAGRRRMSAALPALLKAAAEPDAQIRSAALRQIGELGGPTEMKTLLSLLAGAKSSGEADELERALSAICVRLDNPESAADQLTAAMAGASAPAKAALLRVLSAAGGPQSLQAIRAAAKDAAPEVRSGAIRALGAWKTADAAPDLLELAKTAEKPTEKILALRGYLGFAAKSEIQPNDRLNMCREAAGLIQRNDEKKLLLGALGGINSPQALAMIEPFLDDPAIRQEAAAAVLSTVEKMVKKADPKRAASLIGPLEKIAKSDNAEQAGKAKLLLTDAKAKAAQK